MSSISIASDDVVVLRLIGLEPVRRVVRQFARRHPHLAEDFGQQVALQILTDRARILAAREVRPYVTRVAVCACLTLLRRESRRAVPGRRNPQPRRPIPRRRSLQEVLRSLNGREPQPDFVAALREELAAGRPRKPAARPAGNWLSEAQRATLRAILLGAPGATRQEIAAEFRRRTGRYLSRDRVSRYRKALGLPSPAREVQWRRRWQAGAYDGWNCRRPVVI